MGSHQAKWLGTHTIKCLENKLFPLLPLLLAPRPSAQAILKLGCYCSSKYNPSSTQATCSDCVAHTTHNKKGGVESQHLGALELYHRAWLRHRRRKWCPQKPAMAQEGGERRKKKGQDGWGSMGGAGRECRQAGGACLSSVSLVGRRGWKAGGEGALS